jgi:hypothetical protein
MQPRLALSIGAVFNIVAGIALIAIPAQILSASGWPATPDVALIPARDAGTVLLTLGIIDWLARDAVGAPLRGLLWGNLFRPAASIVINTWETVAGMIPVATFPFTIAALGLDLVLIVIFVLALRRA